MYRFIQKILFLEDRQVRRWGRLTGYGCIVAGFIFILAWPFLNQFTSHAMSKISGFTVNQIREVASSSEVSEATKVKFTKKADTVAEIFEDLSSGIAAGLPLLVLGLGLMYVAYGFTSLKCYELVLEKAQAEERLKELLAGQR